MRENSYFIPRHIWLPSEISFVHRTLPPQSSPPPQHRGRRKMLRRIYPWIRDGPSQSSLRHPFIPWFSSLLPPPIQEKSYAVLPVLFLYFGMQSEPSIIIKPPPFLPSHARWNGWKGEFRCDEMMMMLMRVFLKYALTLSMIALGVSREWVIWASKLQKCELQMASSQNPSDVKL